MHEKQDQKEKIFAVAQTDQRQAAAGRALAKQGYHVVGAEETAHADYILLPLPLDDEHASLAQLLRAAKPGAIAFGGKVSEKAKALAQAAKIELLDYFARPELAILNAIPTAEGCIALLFAHRKETLWGAKVMVIGFGRVAKALVERLLALGAKVTVVARSTAQRAEAFSMGCKAVELADLPQELTQTQAIVNTVPAMMLPEQLMEHIAADTLIVDLASRPGGVDFEAAKQKGIKAIQALSLPAACAPNSAGEYVATTVLEMLAERGEKE